MTTMRDFRYLFTCQLVRLAINIALQQWLTAACDAVAATERTDHTVANRMMTAIWSHGQSPGNTPGISYFYRPDEIKYHANNRGRITINFHG